MRKLYLESKENSNCLIITGEINTIFSNRRATRYIKDNLQYIQDQESLIIYVDHDLNKTIDRLKKVCEYVSAELVYSGSVSEAVNQYAMEEEKFSEFAEKARLIRDNCCDHTDFKVFIDSVSENLKNRSLYCSFYRHTIWHLHRMLVTFLFLELGKPV